MKIKIDPENIWKYHVVSWAIIGFIVALLANARLEEFWFYVGGFSFVCWFLSTVIHLGIIEVGVKKTIQYIVLFILSAWLLLIF